MLDPAYSVTLGERAADVLQDLNHVSYYRRVNIENLLDVDGPSEQKYE